MTFKDNSVRWNYEQMTNLRMRVCAELARTRVKTRRRLNVTETAHRKYKTGGHTTFLTRVIFCCVQQERKRICINSFVGCLLRSRCTLTFFRFGSRPITVGCGRFADQTGNKM